MRRGSMQVSECLLVGSLLSGVHEHPHATARNKLKPRLARLSSKQNLWGLVMSSSTDLELRRRRVSTSPSLCFSLLLFIDEGTARTVPCRVKSVQ